jgi:tryptophan halogenase
VTAGDRQIGTVAVAGDGIAAWSAAAALAKRVPRVAVAVVPSPGSAQSMADLLGGSVPSIRDFHSDIGIEERHLLENIKGGYRLGTLFAGWTGDSSAYVHAFGKHGTDGGSAAFHHHWLRAARGGSAGAFDHFSVAAMLARRGRFLPAEAIGDERLATYSHALQLDPARYRDYLHAYARHLGVIVTAEPLAEAVPGERGLAGLRLSDGTMLTADLYVDATGTEARLLGVAGWDDWSRWLPCNRLRIETAPSSSAPTVLDRVTTSPNGWTLHCAHSGGTVRAEVTADATPSFTAGRRHRAWVGNVVAIGEAYMTVEPLEAVPLHIIHAHVDRLIASLPDRDFAEVELAQYNREVAEEADRLRDFLILHYATADRPEPFWQAVAAVPPPAMLAETLALFRERGRLPIRDGDSFARDSWLAVLIGQGVLPRRHDVLADVEDADTARAELGRLAAAIAAAVDAAPPHAAYLGAGAAR